MCSSGAVAWEVARAFGYRPCAEVGGIQSVLRVYLSIDKDRARYEFPLSKKDEGRILEAQYGCRVSRPAVAA